MIPNFINEVAKLRDLHPDAWRNAHTGNAHTEDFIRLLAKHLHENFDARVGLNGKRGNPNDISDDALNILDAEDGPGSTPDGRRCWVVDVIGGAGGPNPQPQWGAMTDPVASTGAWVRPSTAPPQPKPTPPPPPVPQHEHPGREEMMKAGEWLDAFYRSSQGLQRSLTKDGSPDWEGIGAWLFDVYFISRVNGKTVEQAQAAVVTEIQKTEEWQRKHS